MPVGYNMSMPLAVRTVQQGKKNCVSWSRQGHIAYALDPENDDNFIKTQGNLRITYLECIDGKHWQLAPPTFLNIPQLLLSTSNPPNAITHVQNQSQSSPQYVGHKKYPPTDYLAFSNTGWDLFTADIEGNVTILVTGIKRITNNKPKDFLTSTNDINDNIMQVRYSRTSFNTCEVFYSEYNNSNFTSGQPIKGNRISSMKWLNLDKAVISNIPSLRIQQNAENQVLNGCASKMGAASDDSSGFYYRYNAQQNKSYGASHPLATKQACIAVRQNGEICMYHQEEHGIEYDKVSSNLNLNEPVSEDDLITISSIGYQKDGKIIVAAYYSVSAVVKIFEIEIDWAYLDYASKMLAENPNYRVPDDSRMPPSFKIKKIHQKNIAHLMKGYNISGVELISPNFEQGSVMEILFTFDGTYKHISDPGRSAIMRYQLETLPSAKTIHQSFKDIASKNGVDVTQYEGTTYNVKYVQLLQFNDLIVNIEMLHLDMYLSVVFASGIIKIFKRTDFTEERNKFSKDYQHATASTDSTLPPTIATLLDAGFEFPNLNEQSKYLCLSPNMCCYVTLPLSGRALEVYTMATDNIDEQYLTGKKKGLLLAKAAAIALRHTTACYFGYFTDDLVATVRNDLVLLAKVFSENYSYRLMVSILQESHRAINLNIDIPPEQSDKMTQNQPLQRLLTLQLSLGTSENWKKTRSGKIALALVNLRYVASSVMYTIHTIYSNMQRFARKGFPAPDTLLNAKMREECILSVIGVIRWCLDYVVLLSQELMELHKAFKSGKSDEIEKLVKNSIVIPLVLGKIPRSFLIFSIANIRRLFSFVQKFIEKNDPTLTSKITAENPFGAFDIIEDMFFSNDASVIQKKLGGSGRTGAGAASKTAKSLEMQPTFEAYYRLGSMIKRLPVSLVAFEKFITEADGPLRNMKLDAPMSLAVEQQIVCQGYVSENFVDAMKKLTEVFHNSVLSHPLTSISDLYFYDTTWLDLEDSFNDGNVDEYEEYDDYEDIRNGEESILHDDVENMMDVDNKGLPNDDLQSESTKLNGETGVKVKEELDTDLFGATSDETGTDTLTKGVSVAKHKKESIVLSKTDMKKNRAMYKRLIGKNLKNGGIFDSLRKEWVSPEEIMKCNGESDGRSGSISETAITETPHTALTSAMTTDYKVNGVTVGQKRPILRKCIRCGDISVVHDEVMFIPNSMAFVTNPVFQHYQRICICGGSWANM